MKNPYLIQALCSSLSQCEITGKLFAFLCNQTQSDPCVCLSMNMRFQAARNAGYLGGDTRNRRAVRHCSKSNSHLLQSHSAR